MMNGDRWLASHFHSQTLAVPTNQTNSVKYLCVQFVEAHKVTKSLQSYRTDTKSVSQSVVVVQCKCCLVLRHSDQGMGWAIRLIIIMLGHLFVRRNPRNYNPIKNVLFSEESGGFTIYIQPNHHSSNAYAINLYVWQILRK